MINMSLIPKAIKRDEKRCMIALTLLQREGMKLVDDQVRKDNDFFLLDLIDVAQQIFI